MSSVDHRSRRGAPAGRRPSSAPLPRIRTPDGKGSRPVVEPQGNALGEFDLEVRHISLPSVAHVATIFAFVTVVIWMASIGILWAMASTLDVTHHIEHFVHSLGFEGFTVTSTPVLLALWIAGTAWVVGILVIAVLGAAIYNWFAWWFGGVRISVAPDAVERRRVS